MSSRRTAMGQYGRREWSLPFFPVGWSFAAGDPPRLHCPRVHEDALGHRCLTLPLAFRPTPLPAQAGATGLVSIYELDASRLKCALPLLHRRNLGVRAAELVADGRDGRDA